MIKIVYTDHDHSGTSIGCTGKAGAAISQKDEDPKSRFSLFHEDGHPCEMNAS